MPKIFFNLKQGATLALEAPNCRSNPSALTEPPRFSLGPTPGRAMDINPAYRNDPCLTSKLKHTQRLIRIFRASIADLEASEPNSSLLFRVRDQLKIELKIWADVTGGQPCL